MMTPKRTEPDPDEFESAETVVLDEDDVMETAEFKKLVALDAELFGDKESTTPADNLEAIPADDPG